MLIQRHKIKPCMPEQPVEFLEQDPIGQGVPVGYDDLTKNEIVKLLEEAEIEHDARQKKETLIELLKAGN